MDYRRMLRGFLVAALVVGIAGTGRAQDAALIEAAKKEGEVVWYTGMIVTLLVRPVVEAFDKKYGIKVKFSSVNDADTVLRMTNEARAGKYEVDIFDTPGTVIPALSKVNLIGSYVPAAAKDYPADLKGKDGLWTGIFALYLTASYNTDLVKDSEAPRTFQDLLDPKWKGRMVWVDNRTISGPAGFIANVLNVMGNEAGMAYLRKLAQQKIVGLPSNQRVVLDQVIAGQYAIGLMTYNHHVVISQAKGAPIKWVKMEPLVANVGAVGMSKYAPHPNASKLFLEFLFSEEGQKVVREANYPPAHPMVAAKDPSITPTKGAFKITTLTPEMTEPSGPLQGWLKIYDELFKQ
ncbi:MAG: extracellular solute-binding protein [Burkholderiales bacterium]|nr:extracellular solute-binding protein [Burkholderiales bacterium]